MANNNNNVFSTTLQTLRKKKGVTQEQLANALGVSAQAVSKWENGSYPEGDLLPRLSDFFGVSISYLYGQEKEKSSIEQTVMDELYDMMEKHTKEGGSGNYHPEYFDKMLDIVWAFQIGCWKNNKYYFKRGIPEEGIRTASVIADNAGFGYFNLNRESQFYTIVREPEEGFDEHLKITPELRRFFGFLGQDGALEIFFYLFSLFGEYVTVTTIAENIGMSVEATEKLMNEIMTVYHNTSNPFIIQIEVIGTKGSEKAYGIDIAGASLFVSLLLTAESLMYPPYGYQMQVNSRGKSVFDREKVLEMIKENRSKKTKQNK